VPLETTNNAEQSESPSDSAAEEKLEQLRSVLLAPQQTIIADLKQQVLQLETRLADSEKRSVVTNESLVGDINNARKSGDELGTALKPIVIDKFHEASRDDPETMADALFPILGPAVRKMIVNMITPDKNAKRFGYQVEQLFLIDKNTGLPICHVASDVAQSQDADMVSGMLSAIQSFVHDAFETDEFDGLNTLQLGELSVWIEWGPKAILKIEEIHRDYESELTQYDGSGDVFEPLKPNLHTFLNSHDGSLISSAKNLSAKSKRNLLIAAAALALFLAWLIYSHLNESKWNDFLEDLRETPGVVVTDYTVESGVYKVFGLRDPLSQDPHKLLSESDIDRNVQFHFEPYHATSPVLIERRAHAMLLPSQKVEISVIDSTLYVSGEATAEWIMKAKPISNSVTGVELVIFNVRQAEKSQ